MLTFESIYDYKLDLDLIYIYYNFLVNMLVKKFAYNFESIASNVF